MDFNKYFEMLVDWKKLPAYRLEPRIDTFIGYYLKDIISDLMKTKVIGNIPEFPIRGKTIFNNFFGEKSFRVDFLLITENNPNYLVEFKTDSNSRREGQDKYLLKAKEKKLGELIKGLKFIYEATLAKNKYDHLIAKLKELSLLNDNWEFIGKNEDIEIIYIQPRNINNENNVIDFNSISSWIDKKQNKDNFEIELGKTLLKWVND